MLVIFHFWSENNKERRMGKISKIGKMTVEVVYAIICNWIINYGEIFNPIFYQTYVK